MPGMGRRPMKYWEEQDAYTGWRRYLVRFQRAGAVKAVKQRTHKRERREATYQLKKEERWPASAE